VKVPIAYWPNLSVPPVFGVKVGPPVMVVVCDVP